MMDGFTRRIPIGFKEEFRATPMEPVIMLRGTEMPLMECPILKGFVACE
jgi:hypothetical protein